MWDRIGETLRSMREELGIRQGEVAVRCGVTPGAISNVENGRGGMRIETLSRVCGVLGLSVSGVLEEAGV